MGIPNRKQLHKVGSLKIPFVLVGFSHFPFEHMTRTVNCVGNEAGKGKRNSFQIQGFQMQILQSVSTLTDLSH